ncbi:hypothetical protein D8911_11415 [Levilactobacillus brevis]|nr:hypothetical protein D8911_11415 [Levilactobacillus brevis]
MTVTVGGDKISRLTLAGNEFLNAEDVWQECTGDNRLSGTPTLMKYEPKTGISSFLGRSKFTIKPDEVPLSIAMLTLPVGYHFTGIDTTMGIAFGGWSAASGKNGDWIASHFDGRTVWMDVIRLLNSASPEYRVEISLGNIAMSSAVEPVVWHTTTVAPD